MLSPRAFKLIIKHLNEIDKIASKKTMKKRPWMEVAITSLFCDLLDNDSQVDQVIEYSIEDLRNDLVEEDELFDIDLSIDTVQFPTSYERYITQSDIGIRFKLENKVDPKNSWRRPYLFQAKRIIPNLDFPKFYDERARFGSMNKEQQERIKIFNASFGKGILKYLLYCPRPEFLEKDIRTKLAYLRNKQLSNKIFDYTKGLNLHHELMSNGDSIKAGVFITDSKNDYLNLGDIHEKILSEVTPFSWFVAENFNSKDNLISSSKSKLTEVNDFIESIELINGVLDGNKGCIDQVIERIEHSTNAKIPSNFPILPKYVLEVTMRIGGQLNSNQILFREQ